MRSVSLGKVFDFNHAILPPFADVLFILAEKIQEVVKDLLPRFKNWRPIFAFFCGRIGAKSWQVRPSKNLLPFAHLSHPQKIIRPS